MPSLQYAHENLTVTGIVTQPDKPRGRGLMTRDSPIKSYALNRGIRLYQPERLKDENLIRNILEQKPDFIIAVSFGMIFPGVFLEIPGSCCINVHPSLLPGYKGPNPIQWALIHGEEKTGVTSHVIEKEVDSGKILFQSVTEIFPWESYDELYQRLAQSAVSVLKNTLPAAQKRLFINPSDPYRNKGFYARKLEKEDQFIKWTDPAKTVHDFIRALCSRPGAVSVFRGEPVKIYKSEIADDPGGGSRERPGRILYADRENGFVVSAGDGALRLLELQRENKKRMSGRDFINGMHVKQGEEFHYVQPSVSQSS